MIIGKNLLYERIDFHQIAVDMVKAYKLKSKVIFGLDNVETIGTRQI